MALLVLRGAFLMERKSGAGSEGGNRAVRSGAVKS
jgi:hypothetical protein